MRANAKTRSMLPGNQPSATLVWCRRQTPGSEGRAAVRSPRLYPLTFFPVFRNYMWGGRRLETMFGRNLPPGIVAESWEISGHSTTPTRVARGPLADLTLPDVLHRLGLDLMGHNASELLRRERFPLLVKLLDANLDLSVQVHPNDYYALAHEGDLGKTEMWYVLHAEPDAQIICGLRPGVTREVLARAVASGRVAEALQRLPVRAGDAICLPAGTVHALLSGLVVAEIQQNSDATYRVYDWGRTGPDGRPRLLHTERALEVIAFGRTPPGVSTPTLASRNGEARVERLASCAQFVVERLDLEAHGVFRGECDGTSFEIWGAIAGVARLEAPTHEDWPGGAVSLRAVGWALLPAALGRYALRAQGGPCTLLRAYVPAAESWTLPGSGDREGLCALSTCPEGG